ncbi:MAG: GTPase Era [Defluviicoccus sp.]|nr:GTPase Era [Defluviicoccus sp.]MDE0276452.1 GTPase Era [Defluviicoccus sp.]
MAEAAPGDARRCGFVAVIGAPNAGKSTLTNRLVGAKVSIVTAKAQTTRYRVSGVAVDGAAQLVYVDTPGIFEPRRRLDRAMVAAAWTGAADADIRLLLIDARKGIDEEAGRILAALAASPAHCVLALNKIDLVRRERTLGLSREANEACGFEATFMISAATGDGTSDLAAYLAAAVPPGPWLYPEDQLSDMNDRLFAAEITREKLFERLHQELPYALTVETEDWQGFDDGSVRIAQTVFVERDSQKGIVLGRQGARIKSVREQAATELEAMLERKVHLFIFVKVRQKWGDDPERFSPWGLDFNA